MTALTKFVNAAQAILDAHHAADDRMFLSVEGEGRYTRIVKHDRNGNGRAGYAVVDSQNGNIHRMTSLKAFHKAVRGNIYGPDATAFLTWFGVAR